MKRTGQGSLSFSSEMEASPSVILRGTPKTYKVQPVVAPSPEPPSEGFSEAPAPRKRHREDMETWTEGGLLGFSGCREPVECTTPVARRPRLFSNQHSCTNLNSLFCAVSGEKSAFVQQNASVDTLPSEIWTLIFSHLSFKDVSGLRGLCALFKGAVDDLPELKLELCGGPIPCEALASRMVGLKSLTIADGGVDDYAVRGLCKVLKRRCAATGRFESNINSITLRNNTLTSGGATALAEVVTINKSITNLDVSHNDIGRTGAVAFAEALKRDNNLQHLNIAFNSIGMRGAKALGDALRRNGVSPKLQSLDVRVNQIRNQGASSIAEALRMHPLQNLGLGGNEIGKDGAISLARSLVVNSTLKVLNFGSNSIGPLGCAAIGAALQKNTSVHSLRLAHCDMEESGATAFAKALQVNTTLSELSIDANNIKSTGCSVIAEALRTNTESAVTILDMNVNEIDDVGAQDLSRLIRSNSCRVATLDLRGNLIGDAGAQSILAAIESEEEGRFSSVTELDMSNNKLSDEVAVDFAQQCRETGLAILV